LDDEPDSSGLSDDDGGTPWRPRDNDPVRRRLADKRKRK
jgi:hypothetical protein